MVFLQPLHIYSLSSKDDIAQGGRDDICWIHAYPTIRMSDDLVIFVRCSSAAERRAFAAAGPTATGMKTNTLARLYRATMSSPSKLFLLHTRDYPRKDNQFCASLPLPIYFQ